MSSNFGIIFLVEATVTSCISPHGAVPPIETQRCTTWWRCDRASSCTICDAVFACPARYTPTTRIRHCVSDSPYFHSFDTWRYCLSEVCPQYQSRPHKFSMRRRVCGLIQARPRRTSGKLLIASRIPRSQYRSCPLPSARPPV